MTFLTRKAAEFAEPARRSTEQNWTVRGLDQRRAARRALGVYAKSGPPRRRSPDSRREAKRLRTETVLSQVLQQPDSWWCSRCWSGNLCFRNRCYKCSAIGKSRMRGRPMTDTTRNRHPEVLGSIAETGQEEACWRKAQEESQEAEANPRRR